MYFRTLILLILLSLRPFVYAQGPRPKADSVLKLLAAAKTEDTNKVKLMAEYFRSVFPANLDSCLRLSDRIIMLSRKLNFTYGIVRGLNSKALCQWYGKIPKQAIPTFNEAYALVMKGNNNDQQALITDNIGIFYMQMGIADSAEKYLKMSVNIARNLPSKIRYAKAVCDLGNMYFEKGDYLNAIKNIVEAKNFYETHQLFSDLIITYIRLGIIYQDMNDFERSISAYREAKKRNDIVQDIRHAITITLNIGVLYTVVNDNPDSAKTYLNAALTASEKIPGQELSSALALVNLSNVAINQENYGLALEYLLKVYDSPIIKNRNHELSAVMINMGNAYLHLGQLDKAEKFAMQGVMLAQKNKFLKYEKTGYEVLRSVAEKRNNYHQALTFQLKADSLQEHILNNDVKQKVAEATFNLLLKQKENENVLLQKENVIKAKTIANQWIFIGSFGLILLLVLILGFVVIRSRSRFRSLNRTLDTKNGQLEELNITKDKFISIIAHDLKSPFNALLGLLTELDENYADYDEKTRREIILRLKKSSYNTFNLLINLLDWSRSQQGKMKSVPEEFRIEEVVDEVISILSTRAFAKRQSLLRKVPGDLMGHTDPNILKAILINLVNNSIKFTPVNGEIMVTAFPYEKGLRFEVKDNGMGIPEGAIGNLFRIDMQYKREGTEQEPGTGLGLVMCREYISLLGGEIGVLSEEGKGSKFIFTIPGTTSKEKAVAPRGT